MLVLTITILSTQFFLWANSVHVYLYINLHMYIYAHTPLSTAYDSYYKHPNPQNNLSFSRLLIMLINTYLYLDKCQKS